MNLVPMLERDYDGAPVVVRTAVFEATDRRKYGRELLRSKERAEALRSASHAAGAHVCNRR